VLARNVTRIGNAAITSAQWSPDATTAASTRCNALPGGEIGCGLWTTRVGARSQLRVPEGRGGLTVVDPDVVWTREGEVLAALASHQVGESGAVIAVDAETGRTRRVASGVDVPCCLSVSSDSRRVAFVDGGRLVVADTRGPRRSQYRAPKIPGLTVAQTIRIWLR
jgi:hypothetical protein